MAMMRPTPNSRDVRTSNVSGISGSRHRRSDSSTFTVRVDIVPLPSHEPPALPAPTPPPGVLRAPTPLHTSLREPRQNSTVRQTWPLTRFRRASGEQYCLEVSDTRHGHSPPPSALKRPSSKKSLTTQLQKKTQGSLRVALVFASPYQIYYVFYQLSPHDQSTRIKSAPRSRTQGPCVSRGGPEAGPSPDASCREFAPIPPSECPQRLLCDALNPAGIPRRSSSAVAASDTTKTAVVERWLRARPRL